MFGLWDAADSVLEKVINVGLTSVFILFVTGVVILLIMVLKPSVVQVPGGTVFRFPWTPRRPKPEAAAPAERRQSDTDHNLVPIAQRPSLLHHQFFNLLQNASNPSFLSPEGGCLSDKDAVNLAFLKDCKFKVFREDMTVFFTALEASGGQGIGQLPAAVNAAVARYSALTRTVTVRFADGRTLPCIPKCYIQKFNAWHSEHTRFCLEGIDRVLASRFYPDWWFRASSALEYLNMAFEMTIVDAANTLKELNGDLDYEIARSVCESDSD